MAVQPLNQLANRNPLNSFSFLFYIDKIPNIEFVLQTVQLPGVTLGEAAYNTRFTKIPNPGEILDYESLDIQFIVDENLENYLAIYKWMKSLGFPTEHEEFRSVYKTDNNPNQFSELVLYILDNHNRLNFEIHFIDAFPTSLSPIELSSSQTNFDYVLARVNFSYSHFTIKNNKTQEVI